MFIVILSPVKKLVGFSPFAQSIKNPDGIRPDYTIYVRVNRKLRNFILIRDACHLRCFRNRLCLKELHVGHRIFLATRAGRRHKVNGVTFPSH